MTAITYFGENKNNRKLIECSFEYNEKDKKINEELLSRAEINCIKMLNKKGVENIIVINWTAKTIKKI